MSVPAPLLEALGISKGFYGNAVLKHVNIALYSGRVHALLGENGAGKSTLINVLSGAHQPDSGQVFVAGKAVKKFSPSAARAFGIAVVQQELSLISDLSIAENIGLGAYPRRFGLIDYSALQARVQSVCALVGIIEPLDMPVGDLALGRRQMVEIAKALFRQPKILILDEPTSSLTAQEAGVLADLILKLRDRGLAILYISHRLNEVWALCSHVTVLKDGVVTADQSLSGVNSQGLVRLMVGRDPGDLFPPPNISLPHVLPPADEFITVTGLHTGMVQDVDFSARRGEIVGIGGLTGHGQEDFLLGLYGARTATVRSASIDGQNGLPPNVGAANAAGMVYVPADRKKEGLVLPHSIATNLLLPSVGRFSKNGLRDRGSEIGLVVDLVKRLTIKGDVSRAVQTLSGGNQQKVALAKWLPLDPSILLLNDPTRGVDIETKREIYLMLRSFAASQKLVILVSSDTPELVHLCDRVLVFREGRIVFELRHPSISEETIVGAAMGLSPKGLAA